ncbi:GerMN domain-containing protein [Nocardioides daeguensis]|uniref:GerMN domain-containing protein n=1 Tax=Nocardioides daeguensis TaxID=908359 RepID=UPI001C4950D2|nr:GerMN domain-containing protein [Nocardioides daeguensis]MBV6729823.1 GerMN domain-containing protein [Nocardioides daeguensis]MCR1774349.1 GerMN domain-containing protein [Nocardioides daeguensis]
MIALVAAAVMWAVLAAGDDPDPAPSPGSTQTTGPTTGEPAAACGPVPAPPKGEVLVYFWCDAHLAPVVRHVDDADLFDSTFAAISAGPTPDELDRGYEGSIDPKIRATITQSEGTVTIDLDESTLKVERFLAGANFAVKSLKTTFNELPGVRAVEITIDGRSLCSLDPECSG